MKSVTVGNAEKELSSIIAMTLKDHDETVIVSDQGSVVLIDEREWENIKDTLSLLNDKASLSALLHGHSVRDAGQSPEGKTPEEIFTDI